MKTHPKNWLVKERGERRKVVKVVRFERRERKFLTHGNNVDLSLDTLFGFEFRPRIPWTQR